MTGKSFRGVDGKKEKASAVEVRVRERERGLQGCCFPTTSSALEKDHGKASSSPVHTSTSTATVARTTTTSDDDDHTRAIPCCTVEKCRKQLSLVAQAHL